MLAPGKGGIEFAFVRWTEALAALGHEVHAVVSHGAEVVAHLSPDLPVTPLRHAFERDPLAILRLHLLIRKRQPDLIITHGNRAGRLLRAAHGGRVPHLAVLHRPRFKSLERYDTIACVSRDLMQQALAQGIPLSRLSHVPNFLRRETSVLPPRTHLSQPPLIGVLGRMVPEKGIDLLLDALPLMQQPARVFIAGDGPERSTLEAKVKQAGIDLMARVRFAGWVEDVAAFYRNIDVLCVPSRSESFGLIVLEAWAAGVPVIATRTSGPSELITHGKDGLLCEITPAALAAALDSLVSDPPQASALAQKGQQTLTRYTMDAVLPHLQAAISQTVRRREAAASAAAD